MAPEEMTLALAIEELRSVARSLDINLPGDVGYAERLQAIADFLVSFGEVLQEGMNGIRQSLNTPTSPPSPM